MKRKIILLLVIIALVNTDVFSQSLFPQSGKDVEQSFVGIRKFSVAIGIVVNDSIVVNNKKIAIRKFTAIGSGLMTYITEFTHFLFGPL